MAATVRALTGPARALMGRNPVVTNVFVYGTLYGCGEATQQTLAGREHYDWAQIGRLCLTGAAIFAPTYTIFYRRLDAAIPGRHVKALLQKIAIDQGIMGIFGGATFFAVLAAMEGKSATECKNEVVTKLPKAYTTGWVYWPIVQFFNFRFLPTHLRAPYVACSAFVWTNFMCYLKSQKVPDVQSGPASLPQSNKQA